MPTVDSSALSATLVESLESAQRHPDGTARFLIPAQRDHHGWARAVAAEHDGGVSAALRIFLDAQLEAGDVLVDAATGFGFIALSGATAPGGMPSVFALETTAGALDAIDVAAREAGGFIDVFTAADLQHGVLATTIAERLPERGRIFLHTDTSSLSQALQGLSAFIVLGRLVAVCVSETDSSDADSRHAAERQLSELRFALHVVRERDGEPELFPVEDFNASGCIIALPGRIDAPQSKAQQTEELGRTMSFDIPSPRTNTFTVPVFSFIAPYCRTGYGIAGAHLLREFLQQNAPVAFFPLGGIDRSLIESPQLERAVARQGAFDDKAPSVRLSQQFDLALHVGRGARIAFPIFELDRFQANEVHHLERQDRLLVTSDWARGILLENGIWRTPIDIVPLGVDRSVFHEDVNASSRPDDQTVFMNVGKLERRKGQLELLRAFEAAFSPKDAVRLVFICSNPFVDETSYKKMLEPFIKSRMASRITLVTKPFATQRELARAMASADCAVFPARAEGWNLEALEMLSLGKQVIASACTAHTEYLTPENSRPITIDALEESVSGETRGRWAAWGPSQHEQLVEALRVMHAQCRDGARVVNTAGIATAKRYSWSAAAELLMRSVAAA